MATGAAYRTKSVLPVLLGFALLVATGCTSTSKSAAKKSESTATPATASEHGIDLNCVTDHIQNPTDSFHYLYEKKSSNPVHEEADITPQTIDGSFTNASGSHTVHGVRSDAPSWQGAWSGLMGIAGMSSAVALVANSSAVQRVGPEKVNGYDAVKYSVDTSRASDVEKGLYRATLGTGGFEKGTWWVTSDGCPVKLELDSQLVPNSGSPETIHYQVSMTRK